MILIKLIKAFQNSLLFNFQVMIVWIGALIITCYSNYTIESSYWVSIVIEFVGYYFILLSNFVYFQVLGNHCINLE